MIPFAALEGAIFDVDDTLLDNWPSQLSLGMHEHSRLVAGHELGKRHGIAALKAFTPEQSIEAFKNASVHTAQAAMWQMLVMCGEVSGDTIEPSHPLLVEMILLKNEVHEATLRAHGCEVSGAGDFVRRLAAGGLLDKLAIASSSIRRDIDIFLELADLAQYFPDDRIISLERFTHSKPNPEPFNLAFATLGLPESARSHVIAFEDDPRGIMSAVAAGLFTCAITTRFTRQELARLEVAPHLIVDSYAEAAEQLELPSA